MRNAMKTGKAALPFLLLGCLLSGICVLSDGGRLSGGKIFSVVAEPVPSVSLEWGANDKSICNATRDQVNQSIVSDGAGGAIIAWLDNRTGNKDIYAQRVDSAGNALWAPNGVPICTTGVNQEEPQIVSDGHGGAIIAWFHMSLFSFYDIFAQRVDSAGVVQWNSYGVPICMASANQISPRLVADGLGGAIITWRDNRSALDVYAQRINALGQVQWMTDGVVICNATGNQCNAQLVSVGTGGAIITWEDSRVGISNYNIYAQRINTAGTVLWAANGIPVCTAAGQQHYPQLAIDGAGGAIITWFDYRSGGKPIYVQRVNATGSVQWIANGVPINTMSSASPPQIVSDEHGGVVIMWYDWTGANYDIFAQRITAAGTVPAGWPANYVTVCNGPGDTYLVQMISDGTGGAFITWSDYWISDFDIRAQWVRATGDIAWGADGIGISTRISLELCSQLVSDGGSGAIIGWQDNRTGNMDIYAQRMFVFPQPTNLFISINNGEAETASTYVMLTISVSGATQVCFSNDGIAYSEWDAYTPTKTWMLEGGAGPKTVYFKASNATNEAVPVSDTINYAPSGDGIPVVPAIALVIGSCVIAFLIGRVSKRVPRAHRREA